MFSIIGYQNLLKRFVDRNYNFSTEWLERTKKNTLYLRHDVDFSVDYAFKLAKLEKKLNIKSSYFFLLTSNMYNPLSQANQEAINEIANMDHKISIHFDPTAHNSLDSFAYEKKIFEDIFNVDIDIISIHRPGRFLENNNTEIFNTAHTYQDKFFKDSVYISDSQMKDPSDKIELYLSNPTKPLHLLLHPIWWVDSSRDATTKLNIWRDGFKEFITDEIRSNCGAYLD